MLDKKVLTLFPLHLTLTLLGILLKLYEINGFTESIFGYFEIEWFSYLLRQGASENVAEVFCNHKQSLSNLHMKPDIS